MGRTWRHRARLWACATVLAASAGSAFAERVTYIHTDALNSPVAGTDASGQILWQEYYRPYGDRERLLGDETNAVWYTGKAQDPGTLLVYMGGRYYNPLTARFVSVDPAPVDEGSPFSLNRYAYANNNPYGYVDPSGETPIDVVFLAIDLGVFAAAVASGNPAAIESAGIDVAISTASLFSPVPGAGQAYKAYRATKAAGQLARAAASLPKHIRRLALANVKGTGKTVLGRFKDGYLDYAKSKNASYFDLGADYNKLDSGQQWAANKLFLDAIADAGDTVLIKGGREAAERAADEGAALANEVRHLIDERGYRWINQHALGPGN